MGFPCSHGHRVGVGGVTAPQTLDKLSGRHAAPDKVFLALLLLNLQRKTGTQYSLKFYEKNLFITETLNLLQLYNEAFFKFDTINKRLNFYIILKLGLLREGQRMKFLKWQKMPQ